MQTNNVTNGKSIGIHPSWMERVGGEFEKDYFKSLKNFLVQEKQQYTIYPPGSQIFSAFNTTPFDEIKVVIIGQDPYHGHGQANGLCFSVSDGIPIPPSLKNIFKELEDDLGVPIPNSGNLERLAKQGVLLINATLTVRANQAGSHQKQGWENFTNEIIHQVSTYRENVVFLLWGRFAQEKEVMIDARKHHILKAAHPSPFSAYNGFLGCKHFSKTNTFLKEKGMKEINW